MLATSARPKFQNPKFDNVTHYDYNVFSSFLFTKLNMRIIIKRQSQVRRADIQKRLVIKDNAECLRIKLFGDLTCRFF
jgi:hypothetical protein